VPAVFSRRLFTELRALDPAQGAQALLLRRRAQIALVDFPAAAIDIDTPEQYEQLNHEGKSCT
jgi:molybdenum cofactor cytidylyltransferase